MVAQRPDETSVRNFRPLSALVPAHWQTGDIVADDGTRIHYTRTGGDKPAVILLHGIQAAGLTWLRTAGALEAQYDVIMPDFRGHGQSGGLEHGFSADVLVNDMAALIRTLGLERSFVVGHSMGADIAGRLAAAYPLRGVALVDPALQSYMPLMEGDTPPPWMEMIFQTMRTLKTQPHAERMVTGLKLLPPGTPLWDEADYVSFIEGQAHFDLEVYRHVASLGYLFAEPEVIRQIECPMLLMTTRPMMPGANIEPGLAAFKDNWRDGQHLHFEDSGHAIPFDQFEKFIAALKAFLGSQ